MQQIQPHELAEWLGRQRERGEGDAGIPLVLDVREDWELRICRIDGSLHIPMQQVVQRFDEIDRSRPIVCVCHHGMRSMQVAMFLQQRGATRTYNLAGGIDAWARQVDPACALY
ncbi:MAG: sulfurtransferase [Limnobacter sp.]|nr:sulfurtransferase [Limnobacter sp.]